MQIEKAKQGKWWSADTDEGDDDDAVVAVYSTMRLVSPSFLTTL